MKKINVIIRFTIVVVLISLCNVLGAHDLPYTSGSARIDSVRRTLRTIPTTLENYRERTVLMYLWVGILQQRGADLRPFYDTDQAYYALEPQLNRSQGEQQSALLTQMAQVLEQGYGTLEDIQTYLEEEGPMFKAYEGDAENFPEGGDLAADWPMFQGNKHNTGYTTAPGPVYGRNKWKFPIGLGWYSQPTVEDGRVYLASPGLRTTAFCLDLATGEELWRATQTHPKFGIYKYPVIASTPVIQGQHIILREVNSHGGNQGQARNLVYIDKQTGKTVARNYAGHVDYRTQHAPVAASSEVVVYPFGVADIYGSPAICQNFDRLVCADPMNERKKWEFSVGNIDALAEPVLSNGRVLQGTTEGYLYALNLDIDDQAGSAVDLSDGAEKRRIAWNYHAGAAINTAVTVAKGRVYFGANNGYVYCLDESTGQEQWKAKLTEASDRTRKLFSTITWHRNRLYFGSADSQLFCLRADDGRTRWKQPTQDWIRAKPVIVSGQLMAADISGKLYRVDTAGQTLSVRQLSSHPIYADLVAADDKLLVNDSHLTSYCLDTAGELVWKKSILDAYYQEDGTRIFTDQLSGGTYYQSKPTATGGQVYFGTPSGFLYAADATSGQERWKFEMGAAISVGPALADGKVYAGQQGGERFFYCVDASDGSLVWKKTIPGGWVWGSAAVDDGMVYVPTVNGYAVCMDAQTGDIVWMYPTSKSIPAEPAIDGDLVYFGSWSRSLYAFDKKTGEVRWKVNGIGLDSGTLIALDNNVYVPHHDNIFMFFDAQTGQIRSEGNTNPEDKGHYTNFNATPAFHDGRGFFTARVGIGLRGVPLASKVYSVNAETGQVHWTFPDGGGLSAPALASGRVYIGSGNLPFLYALDQKTGEPYWIYRMGNRVEESTLCIYRNLLYALSGDGYLHAIE